MTALITGGVVVGLTALILRSASRRRKSLENYVWEYTPEEQELIDSNAWRIPPTE